MPKLTDAIKLDVVPVNERIEIKKPEITYVAKATLIKAETSKTDKIPPVVLIKTDRKKLDRVMIKAGYGNYNNIYAEGFYNTINSRDKTFAAHLLHHSGKSTVKYSNASQQLAELTSSFLFREKSLFMKGYFDNNRYHYYGFNPADSISHDTVQSQFIRQNFMLSGFETSFTNETDKYSKTRYRIDAEVYNLNDYLRLNETGIQIRGKVEQYFKENPIRFEAGFNHYIINSNPVLHRNIFDIKARYSYSRDKWKAEGGFDAPTETDSIESKPHFYPVLAFEGKIINNYLHGFAGIRGGLYTNNYRSLAYENPFVAPNFELRNTNNKFEFYAGFKGNYKEKANYKLSYSYHEIENLLLFINDSTRQEQFLVIYDSSNTTLNKIQGELLLNVIPQLQVFLTSNYFFYYQDSPEPYPWHLPIFDLKTTIRYNIQEKIYMTLDYFLIGKRYAKDWSAPDTPIELKPINDINFGMTYNFSHKAGLYFNLNNILNTKYSYWNNYELRGFNFVAGVKFNF